MAVADVNKDGKLDILVGDVWYEAPDWKMHEIRKPGNYGDGAGSYSKCFACWADDLNGDGWPDLIVIGFPGAPCHWYENPQGKDGHWKEHVICHSACNETPQYARPVRHRQARAAHGLPAEGQGQQGPMAGSRPARTRPSRGKCTPSASRARPVTRSPARTGSRTAWASATSTATAGST